jgi:hypothetical protein
MRYGWSLFFCRLGMSLNWQNGGCSHNENAEQGSPARYLNLLANAFHNYSPVSLTFSGTLNLAREAESDSPGCG